MYLKVKYFHYHKGFYHGGADFKILNLKQMLQRLLIPLAQLKAGNTSEDLLNCIKQKELVKKVYYNIMNSVKLEYKMDTI